MNWRTVTTPILTYREYFERGVAINVLLVESDERLLGESGLPKLREKLVSTHLGLELLGKTGRRHRSLVSRL